MDHLDIQSVKQIILQITREIFMTFQFIVTQQATVIVSNIMFNIYLLCLHKMNSNIDNIWIDFPGCECLKLFLINSGYDSLSSLKCINSVLLVELEQYVGENRWMMENLNCSNITVYEKQDKFNFLPGHRTLLLDWCQNGLKNISSETVTYKHPAFPPILRELINCALSNHMEPPNSRRFSEKLMSFAVYLYIMAGKACYETICANLLFQKQEPFVRFI